MRVLHVIPWLEWGGTERVMIALARRAWERGHQTHICVLGRKNAYAHEVLPGIQLTMLGSALSYRRPGDLLACCRGLGDLIRRFAPDVLHSHCWPAARMIGWARGRMPIPHLVHVHDTMAWLEARDLRSRIMRLLTRNSLDRPNTHFVAVANAVRDYTVAHLPWVAGKVAVVYNGTEMSFFDQGVVRRRAGSPKNGLGITLGVACRLRPNKGVDVLLRALAAAKAGGKVRLLVAGDGGQRQALEALAEELRIRGQVVFIGMVQAMGEFYAQLDAFVLPSLALEGLPMALIEAMACGLPVIATQHAGATEVVRHGVDGLLVPPKDVSALAGAIDALAMSPELRSACATSAANRAKRFSAERMFEQVMAIYYSVATSGKLPETSDE